MGRTESAVLSRRQQLGIHLAAPRRGPGEDWTATEADLLLKLAGTAPHHEIASRLPGRTVGAVRCRLRRHGIAAAVNRWTPEEDAILGTVPDREAARRLCRTVGSVRVRRSKLAIPAFRPKPAPR